MRSDPQSGSDARPSAPEDVSNPFAPIDYASRLKTPVRHGEDAHVMAPLQPGQLYGTAHWMSPPKPFPAQPEREAAPVFPQSPPPGMSPPSGLPPYLRRQPLDARSRPSQERVDLYTAPSEASAPPAAPMEPAQPAHPAARRSRVARHAAEEAAADIPLEAQPLPPMPQMPFDLPSEPFGTGEPPLFPSGGEPGAPYSPAFEPGEPYRPDAAAFSPDPGPQAETDACWDPQESLRDPFEPAAQMQAPPSAPTGPSAASPEGRPSRSTPPTRRPARPPVRPARVVALIAAFMMVVFCAVEGGRILTVLSRNEREVETMRESYLERTGTDLQSGAARVDLLPAGQTYEPTGTPVPTQVVQTPSPTPVIPIRENAVESLNKRDTSNIQETAAPTQTPSPRTRLSDYPDNPLKNIMESLLPLIQENGDVVGKLTIPGVLEEVVVQRNNTYYLTRNYRGSSSDAGAVFVDESCSLRSPPENLLLRGQGAIEGKVFAPLRQYATAGRDFVASATTARLTTLYEEADYVLFAVIVASSDPTSSDYFNYAGYPSFATDADMLAYVESARAHSLYSFDVDVQASDRLLTLATLGSGSECLVLLLRQMR